VSDDEIWLRDMVDAIERIERYSIRGRAAFDQEELYQVWMVHHIQLIGEAARQVSETTRVAHPEVPWNLIVGMRNILVHRYFRVDQDEVWAAVERDLPLLKAQVEAILSKESGGTA
jgi:uncharacterized protein with HEPN domain